MLYLIAWYNSVNSTRNYVICIPQSGFLMLTMQCYEAIQQWYQYRENISSLFMAYSTIESYSRMFGEEIGSGLEGRTLI
jgi:hypothetical protein